MAEREDAAEAPDEIDGERQRGVAEILADELYRPGWRAKGAAGRQEQVRQRHEDADRQNQQDEEAQVAGHTLPEKTRDHSTDRPFSANSPRGRRWMNMMMNTSTRILPSTAPA